MAALPRWQKCWSSYNLSSFLTWIRCYATEDEKQSVLQLYILEHRRAPTPEWLTAKGVEPQKVPLQVTVHGKAIVLPKKLCSEVNCWRCTSGTGGYQFRWVDPRWTPRAALNLKLTPDGVKDEMYTKPWPHGLLPIPQDRSSVPHLLPPYVVII